MQTIITAAEVVKYGPVSKEYPTGYICDHIKRIELTCFSKCYLGLDFYEILIADLVDNSDATDYDIDKTYQLGEKVCFDGCIFESLKDLNTTHPSDNEQLAPCWKTPDKFRSECFNDLWRCHLRYFLALKILLTSIRYSTYQAGARGLTKIYDDDTGIGTVTGQEFSAFKRELNHDAQDQLEIMYDYLLDCHKKNLCDYSSINKVKTACNAETCKPPRQRRRQRIHFKY